MPSGAALLEHVITRLEAGQIEVKLASNEPGGWIGFRGRKRGIVTGGLSGLSGFTWFFMFVAGWFCFGLAGLIVMGKLVKS